MLDEHKISVHAAQRLEERLGCTHPIRHLNKVRRRGSLLWQNTERYALRYCIDGDPLKPVNYVFSNDGWLVTVIAAKGAKLRRPTHRLRRAGR